MPCCQRLMKPLSREPQLKRPLTRQFLRFAGHRLLSGLALVMLAGCCRMVPYQGESVMSKTPSPKPPTARTIKIDLLALDLSSCGRCTRTEANLDAAIRDVGDRLRQEGARVEVRKHVIRTAEDAVLHRFASSPTIRIDGTDIALESRESDCSDCGELCGCNGGVACRVWVWQGREFTDAPREMIVDALLRAQREPGPATSADRTPFTLPANLAGYFASLEARAAAKSPCCQGSDCCAPKERKACCDTVNSTGPCACRK